MHEVDVLTFVLPCTRGADEPHRHGTVAALEADRRRVGGEEIRHDLVRGVVLAGVGDRLRRDQLPDRLQLGGAEPVLRLGATLHRVDGPGGGDPGLLPVGLPAVVAARDPTALGVAQLGRDRALGLRRRRLVGRVQLVVERRERRVGADQFLHLPLRLGAVEGRPAGERNGGGACGEGEGRCNHEESSLHVCSLRPVIVRGGGNEGCALLPELGARRKRTRATPPGILEEKRTWPIVGACGGG